jgi:hypothetical protein
MITTGHLPMRCFGNAYVLSIQDFPLIESLAPKNRGMVGLPEPAYRNSEKLEVGYTVEWAAAAADVAPEWVETLAEKGQILAQRFGRRWMILPGAIEQIRANPRPTSRVAKIDYRTKTGQPMKILPLDERQKLIILEKLQGKSFSEIARELGVSREVPSRVFAMAKRRIRTLQQRGIFEIKRIATELDIDARITTQLIEIMKKDTTG